MKIYFAGSIRGGRSDAGLYRDLIGHLQQHGEVLTEHIGAKDTSELGEPGLSDKQIHDRDMGWVLASDVMVAEVTVPSLGVGYEIGRAIENGKKVLCLYRDRPETRLSAMIAGCAPILTAQYETLEDAKKILDDFFKQDIDV